MKRIILALLLVPVMTSAQQDKAFSTEGLDSTFSKILSDWKCAGMAVAVVKKDQLLYAKGFGYSDIGKKIPVTANTLFAAGSCTKSFTCALIGMLQEEGKLSIDQPATTYLPELHFSKPELDREITLRDMMSHRTGLPRHDEAWGLFTSRSGDSLLQKVAGQETSALPREKWQYNNFMFLAQGKLIEQLTGKSYIQYLTERILKPIGMQRINFSVDQMGKDADRALGYATINNKPEQFPYTNLDAMSPVGGINTSVTEMAKWIQLWINGGKYKNETIIPAGFLKEAISSQMIISGGVPQANNPDLYFSTYGFGWFLSSYRGHYRVEHGGTITGFSANMCFFPTDSIGIVVFTNQNLSQVTSIVRNILADRLLGLPAKDWHKMLYKPQLAANPYIKPVLTGKLNTPAHTLKAYTGQYFHKGYGSFTIVTERDSLFARFPGSSWWLRPDQYDVFEAYEYDSVAGPEQLRMKLVFRQSSSGSITAVELPLEPALPEPLLFTRTAIPQTMDAKSLQAYTGDYQLTGMVLKVQLKNNQTLSLVVPNQPEYELVPEGDDHFQLKGIPGYSVQFRNQGAAGFDTMILQQPNGNFTAQRKK